MAWWDLVIEQLAVNEEIMTPGAGIDGGGRKRPFYVQRISPLRITITSGEAEVPIEKECVDALEAAFTANPLASFRAASLHANEPFPDSADALIRQTTGSSLARGNYVCAILERVNLVSYGMQGRRKIIRLP